jgi:hypothetical protein
MKIHVLLLLLVAAALFPTTAGAQTPGKVVFDPLADHTPLELELMQQHNARVDTIAALEARLTTAQATTATLLAANQQIAAQKETLLTQVSTLQTQLASAQQSAAYWETYARSLLAVPVAAARAPAPARPQIRTYFNTGGGVMMSDDGRTTVFPGAAGSKIVLQR